METVFRSFWPLAVILLLAALSIGQPGSEENVLANHQLQALVEVSAR